MTHLDGMLTVVMAGGRGERLGRLTESTPKPLLEVGGEPVIVHVIRWLRSAGIERIHLATCHLGRSITDRLGDGRPLGVSLHYLPEEAPLGTAGVLGRLAERPGTTLVVNGDVLTNLDILALVQSHRQQTADATVALRRHVTRVPYGVVCTDGSRVTSIVEKPLQTHWVCAGVYLIEQAVCALVRPRERLDMPCLLARAIEAGNRVSAFEAAGYWRDLGTVADLAQADLEMAGAQCLS